jgi:hypothetical protein
MGETLCVINHPFIDSVVIDPASRIERRKSATAGCHRHRFVGRFATVRDAFQISPQLVHRQ